MEWVAKMDHNIYEWLEWRDKAIIEQAKEIKMLREALLDCHHVLHKLMGIVPGNDTAVDEMAKAMAKARSALGEGKE